MLRLADRRLIVSRTSLPGSPLSNMPDIRFASDWGVVAGTKGRSSSAIWWTGLPSTATTSSPMRSREGGRRPLPRAAMQILNSW
jgi:hypothetical protein